MSKSILGLIVAVIVAVVAANLAYRAKTSTDEPIANAPWSLDKMEFVTWNGQHWTAWIRDGQFEQVPDNDSRWSRHAKPGIAYIDWDGETWQAKIDGEEFLVAYRGDWSGAPERVQAIKYQDWLGRNQLRTVDQLSR